MPQPHLQSSPAGATGGQRFEQLDSLRGLAALTVVVHHYLLIFPAVWSLANPYDGRPAGGGPLFLFTFTPLHLVWAGQEAVVFFFVLSGFVLALPWLKGSRPADYSGYLIRRIFRIYPPYLAAVLVALLVNHLCYPGGVAGFSDWFNRIGRLPVDWKMIREHVVFIGFFDSNNLDPVVWSLVHEMRISLIFPLVMLGVRFCNWPTSLAVAFLLTAFNWWMLHLKSLHTLQYQHDYFETVAYTALFILGAVLAKHRETLTRFFRALSRPVKYLLLGAGLLAYTHGWWLTRSGLAGHGRWENILRLDLVANWGVASGITIFILAALSSKKAAGLLTRKVPLFLGRISYSLYLFHVLCLITFLNLLAGKIPVGIILVIAFLTSFGVAALSHAFVEVPAINAGRFLTRRFSKHFLF